MIRLSIGTCSNLSYQPSLDEWSMLYKMSLKQSIVDICFVGVRKYVESFPRDDRNGVIPSSIYYQWLGIAVQIQQQNELMNKRCVELQAKHISPEFKSSIVDYISLVLEEI